MEGGREREERAVEREGGREGERAYHAHQAY